MYKNDEQLARYSKALADYTKEVERISADSLAAVGKDAGPQRYWASVVMTRLVAVASTVLFICPGSVLNRDSLLWDFGSVAAPIRTIFETVLMLFYIGIEAVSEDEWKLRINLIHLHDCTERIRLFYGLHSYTELAGFIPTAVALRERLTSNPAFAALPSKVQKEVLSGDRPTLFGKAEILRRMGENSDGALSYYRFISNYVHNFPFGFHRTGMQQRDGTINQVDVEYSAEALRWGAELLKWAADSYEEAFKDIVVFGTKKFDVRVLRRDYLHSARNKALIDRAFA